jgi:hypothetical protein
MYRQENKHNPLLNPKFHHAELYLLATVRVRSAQFYEGQANLLLFYFE